MTNWCVVILVGFVYLAFYGSATSIKCYSCSGLAESNCTENQTIMDCNLACATVQLQIFVNYSTLYMRSCLPASAGCSTFLNRSYITGCTMDVCSRDYCNGPAPPTTLASTILPSTEVESTTETTKNTPKKDPRAAGSVSSGAFGLIVCLFVSTKILEMLTVS